MKTPDRSRRDFLKTGGMATMSLLAAGTPLSCKAEKQQKTHLISLSFDDGFKKSSIQTAEIFEKYDLSACINVIAAAHEKEFELPNEYHAWPVGDFDLWNELQKRGHEIMPHSLRHSNLTGMPLEEAQELVRQCLDVFGANLASFNRSEAIFNFPYNQSSPELEDWITSEVMAFRTGGPEINDLPYPGMTRLTCTSFGPENIDNHLEGRIRHLLSLPEGWLIYNTHGLDDEGWGPVSSTYLDDLLSRLVQMDHVAVVPVGRALKSASGTRRSY
jgi:peptidoglycan/xylan/chitin deacetylase (PgdA/CDA1 family)